MANPHPKPTAIKLLEGYRKDRINTQEPKPELGIPECPPTLDAIGKAKWLELTAQLHKMGILTKADGTALELICATYSEMRHALKTVYAEAKNRPQLVVLGTNGVQQQSAHYKIAKEARMSLLIQLREFGLTPSSRTRLKANEVLVEDIDEFLCN